MERPLVSTPGSRGCSVTTSSTIPISELSSCPPVLSCPTVVKTGGTQRVRAMEQVCPVFGGVVHRPLASGNLGDQAEGMGADVL